MKFTPGVFEIVNKGKIEFVCTRRVGESGTEFLKEVNLAIYTDCGHQRNDQTANEELCLCQNEARDMCNEAAYFITSGVCRCVPGVKVSIECIVLYP